MRKYVLPLLILFIVLFAYFWKQAVVFPYLSKLPISPYGELNAQKIISPNKENVVCNDRLWDYVYSPKRLYIIDKCVEVRGVIKGIDQSPDGDLKVFLKPEEGYRGYTNIFNDILWNGNIVTEIVCNETEGEEGEEFGYCGDYRNEIKVPPVGAHIKMTGSLVVDTPYGWKEIHPVSLVEVLR